MSHTIGVSLTTVGENSTSTHNLFYANEHNYAGVTGTADLIGDPLFAENYHLTPASPAMIKAWLKWRLRRTSTENIGQSWAWQILGLMKPVCVPYCR